MFSQSLYYIHFCIIHINESLVFSEIQGHDLHQIGLENKFSLGQEVRIVT